METIEALGKYEVKRQLGRGAMGTVYEGWDPIIARRVAIKTVRLPDASDPETEEALARFRREAQAAGRLSHPNIVGVFDYGETADLAYIVMEFVDGPPLKTLLDKHERFALADTLRIMADLLAGLQFSHERGVVHRDIKPANVMLTSAGQAKIADFGIARIESSSMTQAGTVLGTPAYMSPEQFMGQVVDARSDIYSSGVLLYQLLTGDRPFEGSMSAIMHKALNTDPPAPSQLAVTAPPGFDAVVRQAMAKRPEHRYPTAAAFAEAIKLAAANPVERLAEGETTMVVAPPKPNAAPLPAGRSASAATPTSTAVRTGTKSSPLPMLAGALVGLLILAGGGTWWLLYHSVGEPPASQAPAAVIGATAPQPPPVAATPSTPPPSPPAVNPPQATPPAAAPISAPVPQPTLPPPSVTTPTASVQPPPSVTQPSAPPPAVSSPPSQVAPQSPTVPTVTPVAPVAVQTPPSPQPVPQPPPTPPVVQTPVQPPVTAPPVVQVQPPANQSVAVASPETLRRQVAQWASGHHCALLQGDVRDGGTVTLAGLIGAPFADEMRQSLASIAPPGQIDWGVRSLNSVFCPVLDVFRPIAPGFAVGGAQLGLGMADGKTQLHDGEPVRIRLVMPDFAGRLRVDYIAHDGTVQHLYPQLADPKVGIAADPPHSFKPGEVVPLGNPAWTIGEPYGTDMITAVASSEPLFDKPRPSNAEAAEVYLRDLQAAIDAAQQRGAKLAGAAVTLEALPK